MINLKQFIIKQDLEELNPFQAKALFTYWWLDKPSNKNTEVIDIEYQAGMIAPLPLMSIGDLFEFLHINNCSIEIAHDNRMAYNLRLDYTINYYERELCDVLWKATKQVLINI